MLDQEEPVARDFGLLKLDPHRFHYEEKKHIAVLLSAFIENISNWTEYHAFIRSLYQDCLNLGLRPNEIKQVFQEPGLLEWVRSERGNSARMALFVKALRLLCRLGGSGSFCIHIWIEPLMDFFEQRPLTPELEPVVEGLVRAMLRERLAYNLSAPLAYMLEMAAQNPQAVMGMLQGKPTLSALFRPLQAPRLLSSPPPGVQEILSLEETRRLGWQMGLCLANPRSALLFFVQALNGNGRMFLLKVRGRCYLAWMRLGRDQLWRVYEVSGVQNKKPSKGALRLAVQVCEALQAVQNQGLNPGPLPGTWPAKYIF